MRRKRIRATAIRRRCPARLGAACLSLLLGVHAHALDGGTRWVTPINGWKGFEIITQGDDPNDGLLWAMPDRFDGLGALRVGNDTLRLIVNHEIDDATISQVDLSLNAFKAALLDAIATPRNEANGLTADHRFVRSARQAYDRISDDGGASWTTTQSPADTALMRFCSSQSFRANSFGPARGFADDLYLSGNETATGRLYALDLAKRDFYQLSGVTGGDGRGLPGIPFESYENTALLDTGETGHVALLFSSDYMAPSQGKLRLYIGQKGVDAQGNASDSFLARNGLAYGSFYYLHNNGIEPDTLDLGTPFSGVFDTAIESAYASSKLEDVDTAPHRPTTLALGDQDSGLFTIDFNLAINTDGLDLGRSYYTLTKVHGTEPGLASFGNPDNVDWTEPTVLGGVRYDDGLIFVNEDSDEGSVWVNRPDGSGLLAIAKTALIGESTGVLDISKLVGYRPGSVVLTANQGDTASITVLINPDAQLALPGDTDYDGDVDDSDLGALFANYSGPIDSAAGKRWADGDADGDGDVDDSDLGGAFANYAGPLTPIHVPEPASWFAMLIGVGVLSLRKKLAD